MSRRAMAPEFSFVSSPGVPTSHLFARPAKRQPNAVRFELHGVVDYHYDRTPSIAKIPGSLIPDWREVHREPLPEPVLPVLRKPQPKQQRTGSGYSVRECRCCRTPFKPTASMGSDCQTCVERIPGCLRRNPTRSARTTEARPVEWFERSAHADMLARQRAKNSAERHRRAMDRRAARAAVRRGVER